MVLSMFTLWILCGPWEPMGFPGGFGVGLGSSRGVYGGARGGPEMKGPAPGELPGPPRNSKWVVWGTCGFTLCAQNVINIVVLVIFNKSCVLLNEAQLDFQEGPGRAPKRVFGALARLQEALGTRVQVHGACLGGRLDRQEFARAQLLREIPSVF